MIKRLIFASVLILAIIYFISVTNSVFGEREIFFILVLSFAYGAFLFYEIYKKYFKNSTLPENNVQHNISDTQNIQSGNPKLISERPLFHFFLSLKVNKEDFYFDEENFYAVNGNGETATFKLKNIVELGATSSKINNRRIWSVKINDENNKLSVFNFAHNYTIWNNNFVNFYKKIEAINPEAIKSKWNFWTI